MLNQLPHYKGTGLPATRDQSFVKTFFCGFRVYVKRLGIIASSEFEYFFFFYLNRSKYKNCILFIISKNHSFFEAGNMLLDIKLLNAIIIKKPSAFPVQTAFPVSGHVEDSVSQYPVP